MEVYLLPRAAALLAAVCLAACVPSPTYADDPPKPAAAKPEPAQPTNVASDAPAGRPARKVDTRVAATVNEIPVTVGEVQREVEQALPGAETPEVVRQFLEAKALNLLIDRQLVLKQLASTQVAASSQEVDLLLQRISKQFAERKSSLADHLRQAGLDEPAFRRNLAWKMSWERYLDRFLTDANLEKYFDQHKREFDGTQLRVAHLLLKVADADDAAALAGRVQQTKEIRDQITGGKLTFAQATERFSQAPTAKMGGDIGRIGRREPMPESFSRAAFALEPQQVSEPVVTAIGVHLIQCLEVQPGSRTWRDARTELEASVTQYLFDYLAGRERASARIEFTNALPHFKPGTEELVTTKK